MSLHRIRGSEAFAYSDHSFSPAYGSLRSFSGRRLQRFRGLRKAWPLIFPLAAMVGAMIGRGL